MDLETQIFHLFQDDWALVTAGDINHYNTMTIGWGTLGTLWKIPVANIYVSPSRYTHTFLQDNDYYTISFFDKEYKKDLAILGSKSGRDGDKVALTKLTPMPVEHGVTFKEAKMTIICKKIYEHQFIKEKTPSHMQEIYQRIEPHYEYVGEVIDIIQK